MVATCADDRGTGSIRFVPRARAGANFFSPLRILFLQKIARLCLAAFQFLALACASIIFIRLFHIRARAGPVYFCGGPGVRAEP